jgi:hypothetical protein
MLRYAGSLWFDVFSFYRPSMQREVVSNEDK